MNNKYFDQILGAQDDETTDQDRKLTQNILDAYVQKLPQGEIEENQRIGVKLQMQSYLNESINEIIEAGEFLNKLLIIYKVKKSQFATSIGIENSNLHALLKGRRKFNSKIATLVGESFNINPELWMFIEAKNELKKFSLANKIRKEKMKVVKISNVK